MSVKSRIEEMPVSNDAKKAFSKLFEEVEDIIYDEAKDVTVVKVEDNLAHLMIGNSKVGDLTFEDVDDERVYIFSGSNVSDRIRVKDFNKEAILLTDITPHIYDFIAEELRSILGID